MVENFNDLISLLFLSFIILASLFYAISIFSTHHAIKISQLEDEYYNFIDEDDNESDDYS